MNILEDLIYVTCAKLEGQKNIQNKSRLMIDAVRRDKSLNKWSEKLRTSCHKTTKIIIVRCIIEKENILNYENIVFSFEK